MHTQLLRRKVARRQPQPVGTVDRRVVVQQRLAEPALAQHPVGVEVAPCQVVGYRVASQMVNPTVSGQHQQTAVGVFHQHFIGGLAWSWGCFRFGFGFAFAFAFAFAFLFAFGWFRRLGVQKGLQARIVTVPYAPLLVALPEPCCGIIVACVPEAVHQRARVELLPPQQLCNGGRRARCVLLVLLGRWALPLHICILRTQRTQRKEGAQFGGGVLGCGSVLS